MKKRLLTLVLVATMALGMGTTAMAEGTAPKAASAPTNFTFKKAYTVNGTTDETVFPEEKLSFTSTPGNNNADGKTANITINEVDVTGRNQNITVSVPELTKLGSYEFTIKEDGENTQGVTYSDEDVRVLVLVVNNPNAESDGYAYKAEVAAVGGQTGKNDTFTNTYDLGSLNVCKVVAGNLGDKTAEYKATVTFTAENPVASLIKGVDSEVDFTVDLSNGTATKEITLKDGETVSFTNIPAGVEYSVEETEKHGHTDTYENKEGTIAANTTTTATITNTLNEDIPTGIIINNLPYILVLAGVALVVVAFMKKRRYSAM